MKLRLYVKFVDTYWWLFYRHIDDSGQLATQQYHHENNVLKQTVIFNMKEWFGTI